MSLDLADLLALNRLLRAELDQRDAVTDERAAEAHRVLEECQAAKRETAADRAALDRSEHLHRARLVDLGADVATRWPAAPPEAGGEAERSEVAISARPPKARLGDQHYLILKYLRGLGAQTEEETIRATGLKPKRVRGVFAEDVERDILLHDDGRYSLTAMGADLLARFEASRRERGRPLPTREEALAADDDDAPMDDAPTEEAPATAVASRAEAPEAMPAGASPHHEPQVEVGADPAA